MARRRESTKTPEPPRTRSQRALKALRDWVITFAVVIAILAPVRSVIADWNDVPTGSMEPTILPGDRIVVNKLAYGLRVPFTSRWITRWDAPERGEIVICYSPTSGDRLVKRVIGVPGDQLSMRNNQLFINGRPLSLSPLTQAEIDRLDDSVTSISGANWIREEIGGREHVLQFTPGGTAPRSFRSLTVPPAQYFVMGDNRNDSGDSRSFGFINESKVHGRSSAVAISVDPDQYLMPRFDRFFKGLE